MGDILKVVASLINLITPDPDSKKVRLEKKQLRLEKKKLRIAKRMYKQIHKEFKKEGLNEKEIKILDDLNNRLIQRRMELI